MNRWEPFRGLRSDDTGPRGRDARAASPDLRHRGIRPSVRPRPDRDIGLHVRSNRWASANADEPSTRAANEDHLVFTIPSLRFEWLRWNDVLMPGLRYQAMEDHRFTWPDSQIQWRPPSRTSSKWRRRVIADRKTA